MPAPNPPRLAIVLVPGFGLGALAGVVDVLAASAALAESAGVPPLLLSADGLPVAAGGGVSVATRALAAAGALDAVFVIAEHAPAAPAATPVLDWLRRQAAAGPVLGGVGAGACWLAEAGLLRGHRAAVHWPLIGALAERHPDVLVSQRLWEIDRDRLSCAGHHASRDLMIAWLGRRHGERHAQALAAALGLAHLPAPDERQRVPLAARMAADVGGGSARLAEAVALMEANVAEPLPTDEIARLVGVSRRQLERLFKQHLDDLPSRWYMNLRLDHARRLLRQTPQSVLQIALGCGFASGPHFSNAYRARFGRTPREERGPRAAAWRAAGAAPGAEPSDLPPAHPAHPFPEEAR